MHPQPFCVRLDAGDAFGDVFGEEKLTGMRDMPTCVLIVSCASDMYFYVDMNSSARVPTRVER